MSKRRSDNGQVRKEDYDADGGGVSNDFSSGAGRFQRADASTLQRRRIVSASSRHRQRPTIAPPPAEDAAAAPAPSGRNVFKDINLAPTSTTASISFAAPSAFPSAAAPSFGGFGGFAANSSTAATASSINNNSRGSTKYYDLSKKLAAKFKTACASNPLTSEMSLLMRQYVIHYDKLEKEYCREYGISAVAAPVATPVAASAPAPAPAAAAAAATPTPAPPAPVPAAAPAVPAAAVPANDNSTNDIQDDEPSARPSARDEGWNTVDTFERVHIYRQEAGWKKWLDGPLVLQRCQENPDNSTRILMRDAAGLKVLVNLSFMGIKTQRVDNPNKKASGFIFKAVMDRTKDEDGKEQIIWEMLQIRVNASDADRMQRGLTDLAKPQNNDNNN